jgi:hypothetical protein
VDKTIEQLNTEFANAFEKVWDHIRGYTFEERQDLARKLMAVADKYRDDNTARFWAPFHFAKHQVLRGGQ